MIDVLPFLFLLLVLATSREPLLRDATPLRRRTTFEEENGRIVHEEELVARGSKPQLVVGE